LSKADLSGADLTDAKLHEADLSGADLTDADLKAADFDGAIMPNGKKRHQLQTKALELV
jgi:uncharacterized protein YjbI with pentapeptide repeats